MAWIGKSQGIFKLHDSDAFCGSYISIEDVAEILGVSTSSLNNLPRNNTGGYEYISELDIHKAWGAGIIQGAYLPRIGNATRSFDELIVIKLLELTLPGCYIEAQVQFGRKFVDIKATYGDKTIFIEFVGPSHFIPQYQRPLISPLSRKEEVEKYFGCECVIWPFWIQRCARNIKALFSNTQDGFASVWSTKAFFGDFAYPNSAHIVTALSERFGAIKDDGIGYMYGNRHTHKPIHPIVEQINLGKVNKTKLIPNGNYKPEAFWLPR